MTTIEELLKSPDCQSRVTVGDRWLYWDNQWVVQCRPMYKKTNRCLYTGDSMAEAITALMGTEE